MITSNKQSRKDITCSCDCCEPKQASVTTRKFKSPHREKKFNGKKKEVWEHLASSLPQKIVRKHKKNYLSVLAQIKLIPLYRKDEMTVKGSCNHVVNRTKTNQN